MSTYHSRVAARYAQIRKLPYGCYFTIGGDIVLFNRRYQPIYKRDRFGRVERDDAGRWVTHIVRKCWFYDDSCSPHHNIETKYRVQLLDRRWKAAAGGEHVSIGDLLPPDWIVNFKSVTPNADPSPPWRRAA